MKQSFHWIAASHFYRATIAVTSFRVLELGYAAPGKTAAPMIEPQVTGFIHY